MTDLTDRLNGQHEEAARDAQEQTVATANEESGGLAQLWRNGAGERAHHKALDDHARARRDS